MLDFFYNTDHDNEIVLQNNSRVYNKKDLKQLVKANLNLLKNKKENIILIPDDNLSFIINFFASIFTKKNIYLIDNIQKKQNLENFDILTTAQYEINSSDNNFSIINQNEVLIHLLTSGSTGEPKEIVKTLTNLIVEATDINTTFSFKEEKLIVSSSTTYSHLFGLTFGLMFPLCNNHIINLDNVEYPDKFNIENSLLVSTPSFLDTVKKNNIILNNAKHIITAGSKLDDSTFEYLEKYSNVIEIYGSTETGVIAYRNNSKSKFLTPFKNISIKIQNDSTIIETPYSYENKVKINDKIELINEKIFLKNRSDRLLKIQEKRISAEILEKELTTNTFVSENYCFKHNNKIACLCVLTKEGKDYLLKNGLISTIKVLKNYLRNKFELIPQKWKFIDIIPKNKTGKIDKYFIERIFKINLSFPIILDRSIEKNAIIFKLYFNKNCNFYNGHFPNFPITPGVAQLYFAAFLGEYTFNKELVSGQIRKIKFSNIINANDIVNLKLKLNETNVSFEYFYEDKVFSSGVFSCQNIFKGV